MTFSVPRGTRRRQFLAFGTVAVALPAFAQALAAYPARAIKLVVPFPPGGLTDLGSRVFADRLAAELGQPVVVDNRAGAAGTMGTTFAMQSPADGYTLLFSIPSSQIIAPMLQSMPGYDGVKDFTPIGQLARFAGVLVVSSAVPVKNVKELVAYVKERPGRLNYGSSGIGSNNHLLGELLKMRTGMHLVHIPYKGGAGAMQALANNEIQVFFDALATAQAWEKSGRVKILAVASAKRSPLVPSVPTLIEEKVFDAPADFWLGLAGPKGLPTEIVSRLNSAVAKAAAHPDMRKFLANSGGDVEAGSPEAFRALWAAEQRRWGDVIRANHIQAE